MKNFTNKKLSVSKTTIVNLSNEKLSNLFGRIDTIKVRANEGLDNLIAFAGQEPPTSWNYCPSHRCESHARGICR